MHIRHVMIAFAAAFAAAAAAGVTMGSVSLWILVGDAQLANCNSMPLLLLLQARPW
jgi:hypothetical protein